MKQNPYESPQEEIIKAELVPSKKADSWLALDMLALAVASVLSVVLIFAMGFGLGLILELVRP